MKYIVIDIANGDMFTDEFATEVEAIREADRQWNRLNETEKQNRESFYIIESDNPDVDADNHYDGSIVKIYK